MLGFRRFLWWQAAVCWPLALAQDAVYLVDAPQLICPGGTSPVSLEIPPSSDPNVPHVLTFYRTSPRPITVVLQLVGANGNVAIPETEVTLEDYPGARRLAPGGEGPGADEALADSPEDANQNCEDYFLLDGRAPVELPDTWVEARDAFVGMCEQEGGASKDCQEAEQAIFEGYPRSHAPLAADTELCARLMDHAVSTLAGATTNVVPLRRMKGWTTSRGSTVSAVYSNGAAGTYGLSSGRIGTLYPGGYRTTDYGYSARGPSAPFRSSTTIAVVLVNPGGFRGSSYSASRLNTYPHGGASSTDIDKGHGCNGTAPCEWGLVPGEELFRDDLMTRGFTPSQDYGFPFTLSILSLTGDDFAPENICPPSGWNGSSPTPGWLPGPRQDLFAVLSPVEGLSYDNGKTTVNPAAWIVPSCVGFCCCTCIVWKCCKKRGVHRDRVGKMVASREKLSGNNANMGVPADLHLSGTYHDFKTSRQGPVGYDFQIEPDGTFKGRVSEPGGPESLTIKTLTGLLHWSGEATTCEIAWNETSTTGADKIEVAGSLSKGEDGGFTLHAEFAGFSGDGLKTQCSGIVNLSTALANTATVMNTVIGSRPVDYDRLSNNLVVCDVKATE